MSKNFGVLVGTTFCVAFVEWVLLELTRMPYNPPREMGTLLGQEKYAVIELMVLVAAVGGIGVVALLVTSKLSLKEYLGFISFVGVMMAVARTLVLTPPWPVTPPELLFR